MSYWRSLSQIVPRKANSENYERAVRLTQAYKNVFTGNPSRDDQQVVLADLHALSGFQKVSPHGTTTEALWRIEGARTLYATIFAHLSLSDADVFALENAARHEAAAIEN
jgi:hypothetical protein